MSIKLNYLNKSSSKISSNLVLFCDEKYSTSGLKKLDLTENGYAMPLELWVQAAQHELKIIEWPVPLIYLDEDRSFGGVLDDATTRLEYYHLVLDRSIAKTEQFA